MDEHFPLHKPSPCKLPRPSPRKSFEPTRLLRQVRHRSPPTSAFVLIQL